VAQLLPNIQREVEQLRSIVAASPTASAPSSDPCSHSSLLDFTESLIGAAGPALAFFFAHPTLRLAEALLSLVDDARTAINWLAQSPLSESEPSLAADYPACCERIHAAIRDWCLAIQLELVARDLDEQQLEALH
jgi:hypothetical protein